MNLNEAINYARNLKRFECRDLTFGDTEIFIENASGTEVGGGYFSRKDSSIWLETPSGTISFCDDDARTVRTSIPVGAISRNDNQGEW